MSKDSNSTYGSLISINVSVKDLLGLSKTTPAITKATSRLTKAITSGLGLLLKPGSDALQALANRFTDEQTTSSGIETSKAWANALDDLPLQSSAKEELLRMIVTREALCQQNREAVAVFAIEHLAHAAFRSISPNGENDEADSKRIDSQIDADWLTMFWECASRKSHRDIQEIFGKILANEAFKPGLIAPATLHVMSILDPEAAQSIERLCSISIRSVESGTCLLIDTSGAGYATPDGAPDVFEFGVWAEHFERAEHLGVISRTHNVAFEKDDNGALYEIGGAIYKLNLPRSYDPDGLHFTPFSAVGRNFRSILSVPSNEAYVKRLQTYLKKHHKVKLESTNIREK